MQLYKNYLASTDVIDSDSAVVKEYAFSAIGNAESDLDKAIRIYYKVRDDIWYDPYSPFFLPAHYRASNIIKIKKGFCIPKAVLLAAAARAVGIPSRLGFADVKNHLSTRALIEFLGSDIFVYHGYTELYIEGKWVKATPAFNKELCGRFNIEPLEFDGRSDSTFQECNAAGKKFMEYIKEHGSYADLPLDNILSAWKSAYGEKRVANWIKSIKESKNTGHSYDDIWKANITGR